MSKRKGFSKLNLLNRFLFNEAMEDPENMKTVLDIATRIFLNCYGKNPEMVSPELIELLRYMEKSTNEVAGSCTSQKIKLLHQKVCQIRSNKKVEARFMRAWEEREIKRQKAFSEGQNEL